MMKCLIVGLLLLPALFSPSLAQEPWVMLYEYASPGQGARELYYDGKLLWNVDNESQTVFTLDPYNLLVIDVYESPVDQPWGITCDGSRFWMTNFGGSTSQLVKLRADTFAVETTYDFPGYYFYGLTYDSVAQRLWISAMNHSYDWFLLEFNGSTGQVVQWHSWPWAWNLGLQYWDSLLYVNTSDWNYPDYTYLLNLDCWQVEDMYICPLPVPEGIATNGVIWWISHFRNNDPYIWKLAPPGTIIHDISRHTSWFPQPGNLDSLIFQPRAFFINYGAVSETNVPFVCKVKDDLTQAIVYYDSLVHEPEISPEEVVPVIFNNFVFLQPARDYTFIFYSNLATDDYRDNDTLKVYVHTEGVVHDLAILTVLEPDSLEPVQPITPQIVVKNQGSVTESVAPVNLEINPPNGSPVQVTASAYDLQPYEIDTIVFPTYNPPETGEYIFTFDGQLPLDVNPVNDYCTVNCTVGMVHDVAPVEISSPEIYEPFGPITPTAIVANLGEFNENAFYTDCSILDSLNQEIYWNHAVCPPLNPGQQYELVFPTFAPPSLGMYSFIFITQLGTDNVPENDSLSQASAVGILWDIAPTAVLNPGTILTPGALTPTAVMTNLGTEPAFAFYVYCLVDTESVPLYVLPQWMVFLEADQSDTLAFQTISISQPGHYRFRFITAWNLDMNPANDTLEFWAELPLGIDGNRAEQIEAFQVEGCYPNPFNSQVAFSVHLPATGDVTIILYNLNGEKVRSYDFGRRAPGIHDCIIRMDDLPSGLYLAQINAGPERVCKKMALLK